MSVSPYHVYGLLLLATLLTGCFGQGSEPGTQITATMAATQTASMSSPSASTVALPDASDRAALEARDESASQAVVSAAQSAPSGTPGPSPAGSALPPAAQTNQPNQADLARQTASAIEAPAATAVAGLDKHAMATLGTVQTQQHQAHAAITNHAIANASSLHPQHVTAQIAHASTVPNTQAAKVLKQREFTSLRARFHLPAALARNDTLASPPPTMQTMSLKMGGVGISNFDDVARVNFAIKTSDNDWTNDYLDPRDTREFGCGLFGECLFWMQTGDKSPVYYTMHHDHRYAIFWDQTKAIWDLRLAVQNP